VNIGIPFAELDADNNEVVNMFEVPADEGLRNIRIDTTNLKVPGGPTIDLCFDISGEVELAFAPGSFDLLCNESRISYICPER
jgi:hypothetical protein